MLNKHKEYLAILATAVLLAIFCIVSGRFLTFKQIDYGSMWGCFLKEEPHSFDVMFLGSSLAYCNVIPAIIWQECEASTYVLGGPEQTVPLLYYYLKEIYRTQSPKYLFIEAANTFYNSYEGFSKVNVGNMPWSINRIQATFWAVEKEERLGLFFPLFNYHGRWNQLNRYDLSIGFLGYKADPLAGYTFLSEIETQSEFREIQELPQSYAGNLKYQQKIVDLATEQNSRVIYYLSPCISRPSQALSRRLEEDLLALGDVTFIDFNRDFDNIGFNLSSDFFDGLHLNYRGAEKFSSYLGYYLLRELGYQPTGYTYDIAWRQRLQAYRTIVEDVCNTN
jgi:hypothetical protein